MTLPDIPTPHENAGQKQWDSYGAVLSIALTHGSESEVTKHAIKCYRRTYLVE